MKRILTTVTAGMVAVGGLSMFGGAAAYGDTTTTTTAPPTTTTTLAPPVQGTTALPLALYVDTVVGSGGVGLLKATVGCALTNEFYIGQTVVFRMWGQSVTSGGLPLTPDNVSSAVVVIPGVAAPLPMNYGNHGAVAFWSLGWKTTGYLTPGIVAFKVIVTTNAAPAVSKRVAATRRVPLIVDGKKVIRNGRVLTRIKHYQKLVIVTPAIKGASTTFSQTGTAVNSQLTLNLLPSA